METERACLEAAFQARKQELEASVAKAEAMSMGMARVTESTQLYQHEVEAQLKLFRAERERLEAQKTRCGTHI